MKKYTEAEVSHSLDINVVLGMVNSTIDKIYASAARNGILIIADKDDLKSEVKAISRGVDPEDLDAFLKMHVHESKADKFKKEFFSILMELASTLRRNKEIYPALNATGIMRRLAAIKMHSAESVTEAELPDVQKAEQKRTQMGRKANEWLKQFNQKSANSSKELQSGNIGTASSDFFSQIAELSKQDWYQFFFKS